MTEDSAECGDRWWLGDGPYRYLHTRSTRQRKEIKSEIVFFFLPLRLCDCFSVEVSRNKLRCICPFEFVPPGRLDLLLLLIDTRRNRSKNFNLKQNKEEEEEAAGS